MRIPQNQDPASLSRLHDIVEPPAIPFWPPAPGWWVVLGVFLALVFLFAWNANQRRRRDAYRRNALRELAALRDVAIQGNELAAVPALLKRTALAGYAREEVASLSEESWLQFLDSTGRTTEFTTGPGRAVIALAYKRVAIEGDQVPALLDVVEAWIRGHVTEITTATGARG